jgi:hypothetical protein
MQLFAHTSTTATSMSWLAAAAIATAVIGTLTMASLWLIAKKTYAPVLVPIKKRGK